MNKFEKQFEQIVSGLNIDDRPNAEHKKNLRQQMLTAHKESPKKTAPRIQPVWSKIMKSNITKSAAAAMILIGAFIFLTQINGTTAWAEVIKAYNNVTNVHIIQKLVNNDGTAEQWDFWLKKPDYLCEDYDRSTIIDNGQERLLIDKEAKTVQFSDSFMPYKPLEKHYMFREINLFRSENQKEIEFVKLDDESNEKTLVFSIKHKQNQSSDVAFKGKAWVDAVSMLPLKIEVDLTSEPKGNEPVSGEAIFEYTEIPDTVFAMDIPDGFTELPRKQRGVMSGTVLDGNGQPISNAIVWAVDRAGEFSKQTITDDSGQFTFKLPPEGVGKPLWLPVLFRAFSKDDPNSIAWSIIRDPANRYKEGSGWEPGGNIPYEVAHIENNGCMLRNANGITLRMESAGTITGHVSDSDGVPVPNAKVQILRCDLADKYGNVGLTGIDVHKWSSPDELGIVRTDASGRYKLTNIPRLWKRTKVFILAQAGGFVNETTSFYVKDRLENETLDLQLYRAKLTIKGTLIDNYNEPIAGQYIYPIVNGKWYRSCGTKTDKAGGFVMQGCPDTPDLDIKAELSHGYDQDHQKDAKSRRYALDVIVPINYEQGKTVYEVNMTAERPELTLNVTVKNTSGEILRFFPVEIRGENASISSAWEADKQFIRRTDKNGKCTFTEVPNVKDLRLILYGDNSVWHEKLTDKEKAIANSNKKYFWAEVPIEVTGEQKEYDITAIALTKEEHDKQKNK